jgi:DNA modification methylase
VSSYRVHLGDAVELMRSLEPASVDAVITDPPYSEHVHASVRSSSTHHFWDKTRNPTTLPRELGFEHLTSGQMALAAEQFARVVRRWVVVFSDVESAPLWRDALAGAGLDYVRTGIWLKPGAAPQFSGDRPGVGFETLVIAHQPGRKRWNGGGKHAVWTHPIVLNRDGKSPRHHPTEKPVGLMGQLVRDFTDLDELIFDPFAGSGSTGVAAIQLDRRFIGVELDPSYREIALRRLAAAFDQPRLLSAERSTA